ncbi:NmrA family NAD(P)-binding protein [Larkinella ripae]
MHIVLGASGQVGSAVVANLVREQQPVRGVIRDLEKADELRNAGAAVALADVHDLPALTAALADGTTLLALTPESGQEQDVIGETKALLANYRRAAEAAGIRTVVGLSSMGAQHEHGTGNLEMSYWLEHAFDGAAVNTVFVRPAYYFSNWLMYLPDVQKTGVLPTLFPPEFSLPMISPMDVADVLARLMIDNGRKTGTIIEVEGPAAYTSMDVADAFSEALGKPVKAKTIDRSQWEPMFRQLGFSDDGIRNFIEMTDAVISGRTLAGRTQAGAVKGKTALLDYIRTAVSAANPAA